MRIRTIKPELWQSKGVYALPMPTRLLFMAVDAFSVGDDWVDSEDLVGLASDVAPDSADILEWWLWDGLDELSEQGLIEVSEEDSEDAEEESL